jgi:hypothetical protein
MMFREQQGTVSKYFRTYFDIAISMYAACWLVSSHLLRTIIQQGEIALITGQGNSELLF